MQRFKVISAGFGNSKCLVHLEVFYKNSTFQCQGSYEALFSKKAVLYKSMDLKNKALTEADYKKLILEHYTFLSRPVFVINGGVYIGNSQQNMLQVMKVLNNV
jgi:arsenate reductase